MPAQGDHDWQMATNDVSWIERNIVRRWPTLLLILVVLLIIVIIFLAWVVVRIFIEFSTIIHNDK